MKSTDLLPTGDAAVESNRSSNRRPAAFAGWCLLVAAAFHGTLWDLAQLARTDLDSHTLLVPFISAYLIYTERRRLPGSLVSSWAPAALLLAVAAGLVLLANAAPPAVLALGEAGGVALRVLAVVCLVLAGGFLCFGSPWMRAAAFPMAFLVFMAPVPEAVVSRLQEDLQVASAGTAAWFFSLAGVPFLRDGVFFRLPGIVIEVAQECSGFRSTYVLFMTSLVAAYLFLRSPAGRTALVAAVIPLGILRNGFRILVLGWLCVHYGPRMIHTWIHHRGGPVFFVLSLVPLFLLLCWLWARERRVRRAAARKASAP